MLKKNQNLWVTILAGGSGSRFWPWSQPQVPKQFLSIPPLPASQSLLQATVARVRQLVPPSRILVVGLQAHAAQLQKQLPQLPKCNFILEPMGRNTAASIAVAAIRIQQLAGDKAMQLVLPADHYIANTALFQQLVHAGVTALQAHPMLLTFGVQPRWAETGYGYIERGRLWQKVGKQNIFAAKSFREKPTAKKAQAYVKAKRFLWNSGMFLWRVPHILTELNRYQAPLKILAPTLLKSWDKQSIKQPCRLPRSLYARLKSISIDYAVMEKSRQVGVMPAKLVWSDLGGWESLYQILAKNKNANVIRGEQILVDQCRHSLLHAPQLQVIAVGVEHLVVAYHDGKLLIADRHHVSQIRSLVEKLHLHV